MTKWLWLVLIALPVVAGAGTARRVEHSRAPLTSGAVSKHDPFDTEDCAACHASADRAAPGAVKDMTSALCLECHDDPAPDARHRHGGAGGTCMDCHNPHNSIAAKLLHAPVAQLCSGCHVDVAAAAGVRRHEPLKKDESCASCHASHGASSRSLLSAPLAETFYAPYSREAYALCFTCHKPALVEAAVTKTATRFRDGDKNLHAAHVMRSDGKGRTCRACHDAHAAPNAVLIADSVPYGSHGWRLPLGFRATESGGSCAKSCHLERSYERTR
jgi:predicted CXXCH cytochrome family protein